MDRLDDVVFGGGTPPMPEEPEIRRDSLGRRITAARLASLKATQFRPGESGNPGGRFKGQRIAGERDYA